MREILFRGKGIDNNWYYGVPLVFTEDYVCMTAPHTYNKAVIPETVGQFTGLYDNTKWEDLSTEEQAEFLYPTNGGKRKKEDWKGKKIFEGDIHERIVRGKSYLFIVKHGRHYDFVAADKRYGWYFQNTKTNDCNSFYGDEKDYVNIIGNIHDNPELLEKT